MNKETRRDTLLITLAAVIVLGILIYAGKFIYKPVPEAAVPEAGTGDFRLPVFETSDMHGNILARAEEPHKYLIAYTADKVNDARMNGDTVDPDRTILLDSGDIYQGGYVSFLFKGESMSALFEEMQYDAIGIGNHEFDWGLETVIDDDATMRDNTEGGKKHTNKIPVVCCDLYQNGEKYSNAQDYVILSKTAVDEEGNELDVRVAVIGFADEYGHSMPETRFADLGYSIVADYDEVNSIASELEESGQCDATILLTHGSAQWAARQLGSSSCVDLVLGGHTHMNVTGETKWGLRYAQPTGKGFSYTYSELAFENDGEGGARIKEGAAGLPVTVPTGDDESKLLDTEENSEELDRKVIDITEEYYGRSDEVLGEEVGYVTVPVTRTGFENSGNRCSAVSNWVLGAMTRALDVDVVFVNKSTMRHDMFMKEGTDRRSVKLSDIYSMLPFDEEMYVYEMTYGDLLDVFNYSISKNGWTLLTCSYGVVCYYIDDPDFDGSTKYPAEIVDALVKDGTVIYKDGQWADGWKDKKLRVAANAFAATTNRNKAGIDNPLFMLNETDSLISDDMAMRETFIEELRKEAGENDGRLDVDMQSYFIYQSYPGDDSNT